MRQDRRFPAAEPTAPHEFVIKRLIEAEAEAKATLVCRKHGLTGAMRVHARRLVAAAVAVHTYAENLQPASKGAEQ
jgi:hypothetical protein